MTEIITNTGIDLSKLKTMSNSDFKSEKKIETKFADDSMPKENEIVLNKNEVLTDDKAELILNQILKRRGNVIPIQDDNGVTVGFRHGIV